MSQRSPAADAPYLEALRSRVLLFDGAMGTSLQALEPSADAFGGTALEGFIDGLVLNAPQLVERVHRSFLEAGADVVETCTFQAAPLRLREWGDGSYAARARELNAAAARLARGCCNAVSTPEWPRFVAGSMGPTGFLPSSDDPSLGNISFATLRDAFAEQALGLIEGDSDLLIIETAQDILEVKAAIFGARRAMAELGRHLPIQAQVTLDVSGRMLLGTDVDAALAILEGLCVDVVGLNCGTGPEHMREPVRYLGSHTRLPISCIPNAGLPLNVEGRAVFPLEPVPMAEELERFVTQSGVSAVGGCCGTTPAHIAELRRRLDDSRRATLEVDDSPRLASGMRGQALRQQGSPLLIGERVNSQGSRAVKRLLLADDYDGILDIARDQVEVGAHALDVCVALTERTDEADQMRAVVKRLQMSVELPICIDSTEASVIEAALETYPGRPIVNSVNLENGRQRCDDVLPLVRDHGACVIALTIDRAEDIGGMAKTRETKLRVAERIVQLAVEEHGLRSDQLIFDALTFTLATGQEEFADSAVETIEGIRLIKQRIPGVLTTLGLSNVSFGLSARARPVLNSVFLYHCLQAGLDTVIINPAHVRAYPDIDSEQRTLAEDLIFNRRPDALARFISHFDEAPEEGDEGSRVDPLEGLAPADRIHQQILHRRKDGIEDQIDLAMGEGRSAVAVLNEILLPAMKDVGDRFGAGELILPFVLQSAEVMKRAVAHVEQFLDRQEGSTKGTVVLATVYGDVHDIGKNLVGTILSNNGFSVVDLGKQVPINTIVERAVEIGADAIGLSALLVSTSKQMPACLRELDERGLRFPVIVGGAAINRNFGRRILYLEPGRTYAPGVFYCKDAFEGLATVDQLVDPPRRTALVERIKDEAAQHLVREAERAQRRADDVAEAPAQPARSDTRTDAPIPVAPFLGPRVLEHIAPESVYAHIDHNSLYKMSWGFKGIRDPEEWGRMLREELEPRLRRSIEEATSEGWLELAAVYGYWPAIADGDSVVVFDPDDQERDLGRFRFPRQSAQKRLCLADYVRPREALAPDERDIIALQLVTAGPRASEHVNALKERGDYDDMLRIHGFSTQMAEATAEYVHQRIRNELRIGDEQGRRYSWGYPACPDLEDHRVVFDIVPAQRIGVRLTEGFQLDPEQSTAAIVMHHPQARYFAVYAASAAAAVGEEVLVGAPEA